MHLPQQNMQLIRQSGTSSRGVLYSLLIDHRQTASVRIQIARVLSEIRIYPKMFFRAIKGFVFSVTFSSFAIAFCLHSLDAIRWFGIPQTFRIGPQNCLCPNVLLNCFPDISGYAPAAIGAFPTPGVKYIRGPNQMPPYQENPRSGDEDPQPLPMFFVVSVTVMRERYFKLLKPSWRGTRTRTGAP
jgi:hypothetical protein